MDVIFDWNLGNMIYNGLITLRRCGFPFTEIQVVSPDNCPNLHVGFSLQYSHQPLDNEGRCQLPMPQYQHMVSTIVWPDNFGDLSLFDDLLLPYTNPPWAAFLVTHNYVTTLRM